MDWRAFEHEMMKAMDRNKELLELNGIILQREYENRITFFKAQDRLERLEDEMEKAPIRQDRVIH